MENKTTEKSASDGGTTARESDSPERLDRVSLRRQRRTRCRRERLSWVERKPQCNKQESCFILFAGRRTRIQGQEIDRKASSLDRLLEKATERIEAGREFLRPNLRVLALAQKLAHPLLVLPLSPRNCSEGMAGTTGLEPATSAVTVLFSQKHRTTLSEH